MSVQKVPTKFRTSDGLEFSSETEANKHEVLLTAIEEYRTAYKKLGHAIAETTRTADGRIFEFGVFRDYWYPCKNYYGQPTLTQVGFIGRNIELSEESEVILISDGGNGQRTRHKISDLYWNKDEAEKAIVALTEEWIAERQADLEADKKRLGL